MISILHLPDYTPTSTNQLFRSVRARIRIKKSDRELVRYYAVLQGLPRATGARQVSLRVVLAKGQRASDRDNVWKSLLDACRHAGLITGDSPRWLRLGTVAYLRAEDGLRETFVLFEDLEA